jgi:hypothetical protein
MSWLRASLFTLLFLLGGPAWADKLPKDLLGRWDMVGTGLATDISYGAFCDGGYLILSSDGTFEQVVPDIDFFTRTRSELGRRYSGKVTKNKHTLTLGDRVNNYSLVNKNGSLILTIKDVPSGLVTVYRRKP